MKKFRVVVSYNIVQVYEMEVEADNEDHAREMIAEGDFDGSQGYMTDEYGEGHEITRVLELGD